MWAIGSRLYVNRPPDETFHELLLHVLRGTLGEEWRAARALLLDSDRHFIMRCFDEYGKWTRAKQTPESKQGEGKWAAQPSGWVLHLMSLAWDVATLIHTSNLPDPLVAHRPSGHEIAVEAESRHRAGVLSEEGEHDPSDPLRGDLRAIRRLFIHALEQAPDDMPFTGVYRHQRSAGA